MNTQFDIAFIRSKKPCYDPARYLPEGWSGSVKGILRHRDIPAKDKLWVVLRKDLLNDKTLRLFAVACARRALTRIPNPDPRSIVACDVAESFANGIATRKELALAAEHAAYAAEPAADVAYAAAYDAAYAAYAAYYAAATDVERQWQINHLITLLEEVK